MYGACVICSIAAVAEYSGTMCPATRISRLPESTCAGEVTRRKNEKLTDIDIEKHPFSPPLSPCSPLWVAAVSQFSHVLRQACVDRPHLFQVPGQWTGQSEHGIKHESAIECSPLIYPGKWLGKLGNWSRLGPRSRRAGNWYMGTWKSGTWGKWGTWLPGGPGEHGVSGEHGVNGEPGC